VLGDFLSMELIMSPHKGITVHKQQVRYIFIAKTVNLLPY